MSSIDTIRFTGLVAGRSLRTVAGPQLLAALRQAGWRQAHNSHFVKRLKERGPQLGINTLNDLAVQLRKGRSEENPGGGRRRVLPGGAVVVYRPDGNAFVTLTHPRS